LERPYGFGSFGQVGARLEVAVAPPRPRDPAVRSAWLTAGATYYPRLWDAAEAFGDVHGEAGVRASLDGPLQPTLVLRAGTKKLFGQFPFWEAAFVGGRQTVRGLPHQRYIGDADVYGSTELRFRLRHRPGAVVSSMGVFALGDVGRVFLAAQPSDRWHVGAGGGLWASILDPAHTLTLTTAAAEGHLRFYLHSGLFF
jgi:hypothetical protein